MEENINDTVSGTIKSSRPSLDSYFMSIARVVAARSTCRHRSQGVLLVRDQHIVSTGYNGSPPKQPHCIDLRYCAKEHGEVCRAEGLHGESNAIASAALAGISTKRSTAYCVFSPCRSCCNLLRSAGVEELVYEHVYDHFILGPEYLVVLGIGVRQWKES